MRSTSCSVIALLLFSACASASGPEGSASSTAQTAPQLSLQTMKDVVRTLSSDDFGGRAPGSEGETKTLDYITKIFAQSGLKPGNNGSWFQDVPLVEITAKNISPLTFTGGKTPLSLAFGKDMVVSTYRVTGHISIKDSPVVFVGYGINAPERNWNDYAGVDVKGKTVIILVNDPDYAEKGLDGPFGGRAMTYYGRWTYKYEEAARQGAAAAIIIHDTFPAAYGWNVVESSWSGPQHVADAENGHMDQTKANGWIQLDQARKLMASAGQNLDKLMTAAKKPSFKAVDLGVKASVSFDNDITKQVSKNVVGILPGTKRPDETVLYMAHWDHLGHCKPDKSDDGICNGAVDNATGIGALAALAQASAKTGSADRSLVFVAVTAEESGLLGSEYYGDHPIYPLAKTVGGINIDAMQPIGPARNVIVVGKGKSELEGYLNKALKAHNLVATGEPTPEKGYYYRSDHFSLAKHGVPMLYTETGDDLVQGGTEAGKAALEGYIKNRYHSPKDEYNPNWDWRGVMTDLQVFYDIGRELANSTAWPNWNEGDEFRRIRDESTAERN